MLVDRAGLTPQQLASLAAELEPLHMLGDVVRWAARRRPPTAIVDVITQDEYTHDVVVPLAAPLHLVFDTT
jgi:hypothetical protein